VVQTHYETIEQVPYQNTCIMHSPGAKKNQRNPRGFYMILYRTNTGVIQLWGSVCKLGGLKIALDASYPPKGGRGVSLGPCRAISNRSTWDKLADPPPLQLTGNCTFYPMSLAFHWFDLHKILPLVVGGNSQNL